MDVSGNAGQAHYQQPLGPLLAALPLVTATVPQPQPLQPQLQISHVGGSNQESALLDALFEVAENVMDVPFAGKKWVTNLFTPGRTWCIQGSHTTCRFLIKDIVPPQQYAGGTVTFILDLTDTELTQTPFDLVLQVRILSHTPAVFRFLIVMATEQMSVYTNADKGSAPMA
jgi:hypothetical protein